MSSTAGYGRRSYRAGAVIFRQGDRGGEAYLVESGTVRLLTHDSGTETEIAVVGRKAIFGEMAVISDMNRMATAVAVEPTTCIVVDRGALQRQMAAVDTHTRDAVNFLVFYTRDFLPFEMHAGRATNQQTRFRDEHVAELVRHFRTAGTPPGLDPFLGALYGSLVDYAVRRMPPALRP